MYFLLLNYENDNTCRSPSLWRRLDSGSRWFDYNLIRLDVGSFISWLLRYIVTPLHKDAFD